ncbi:DUF3822 family protein [Bacteroidota bacterium]
MQDFAFNDETLDINLTQSYFLSIQVSVNGLSFCILDPVREKYIAFSNINFQKDLVLDDLYNVLEDHLHKNELLSKKYKHVKLIWLSHKNTLIPNVYFKKENLKKYFEFNQKLEDLDEIHFNKLKYIDAYSIFTVPNQVANIFIKQFPKISFYNQQAPFIENTFLKYHSDSKKVFVNINYGFIDLIIIEKGKLLLYNNFAYKTDTDIIYFVLYVFDQFKLNTQDTELILSGHINKESKLYSKLNEFIGHIKFDKPTEDFAYSYTFKKIPQHSFINLFNLHLCE